MALTYDGTNGIFTRLGKLFGMADAVRTHQLDLKTKLEALLGEYTDADNYMIAPLAAAIEQRLQTSGLILSDIQQACYSTLIEMCYAEALTSTRQVMNSKELTQALLFLAREMALDSETVDRTTVSKASVQAGPSNTGNGTLIFSELPPLSYNAGGTQYPNIRTERLEVRCVQDAQDGAIRSGEEVFEVRGWPSFGNLDYRFPAGSGTRLRMPCVHAGKDAGARYENLLRNSGFDAFTSNLPDGWTAVTGTAGTHFVEETSTVYRGDGSLELVGNGSTLTKLRQQMGTTDGSPTTIVADRLYLLTFVARTNGSATQGEVKVSLQDSGGTVVGGAEASLSYLIGSSWTRGTIAFRAPLSLPSTTYAAVQLTTAINSGGSIFVDEIVLSEMRQIAAGGVGLTVVAGSSDFVVNDYLSLQCTNNGEGEFNTAFDRMFQMYEKGIVLPNSGTPTISDTLIS